MSERDGVDDPVADALLSDSPYERISELRYSPFDQSIPRKLVLQSGLLFLLALVLPMVATYPAEVRATFDGTVVSASPNVLLLGGVGGSVVFLTGLALTLLGFLRVRLEPRMTEDLAHRLLGLEDVASLLGIGTGGTAILLTIAYLLMGYVGPPAIEWYVDATGLSPFAPSGVEPLSVGVVATLAFGGGIALLLASHALRKEFRLRLDEGYGGSPLGD